MIKNNTYVIYSNNEFRIFQDRFGKFYLKTSNAQDAKNYDFVVVSDTTPPVYVKEINRSEVGDVFFIRTFGVYKGHEFPIEGENETQYFLRADNWDDWVQKLGFVWHDRDDITKDVNKSDVDPVYERKTLLPDFFD